MLIARQAIFNQCLGVYGYELLFRTGQQSTKFDGSSAINATASVLDGFFESGMDLIVEDKFAFINFDAEFILSDAVELIAPDRLIVEVLEHVEVDSELINKLSELKEKGYKIALDDFVNSVSSYPLIPLADIIKFDLIETPLDSITAEIKKAHSLNKILLAEKIETQEEFQKAKDLGFQLFQGFFFSKPSIVGKSNENATAKLQFSKILNELKKDEPSYDVLAGIIGLDANLTYRILSVSSKRSGKDVLNTVKKALMYMGFREIELWISIIMMRDFSKNKPLELMNLALIRSKFAELTTSHSKLKQLQQEASMLGLLSTIDAMLDLSFPDALQDLSLPSSITDALIHGTGLLMPIYELTLFYEQGNWGMVEPIAKSLDLDEGTLIKLYIISVSWAKEFIDKL